MDRDIHLRLRMVMVVVVDMVSKVATVSRVATDNKEVMDSKEVILVDRMVGILVRTMDILLDSTMDTMDKDMEISMGMGMGMAITAIKGSSHDRQVERI